MTPINAYPLLSSYTLAYIVARQGCSPKTVPFSAEYSLHKHTILTGLGRHITKIYSYIQCMRGTRIPTGIIGKIPKGNAAPSPPSNDLTTSTYSTASCFRIHLSLFGLETVEICQSPLGRNPGLAVTHVIPMKAHLCNESA